MTLTDEIRRKMIHLSFVVFPISYGYLDKRAIVAVLSAMAVTAVVFEWARRRQGLVNRLFDQYLSDLFRSHEAKGLTGATYLIAGFLSSVLLFDQPIARAVMGFAAFSDALAAMIGRSWGRLTIKPGRTVEGSAAFLVSALCVGFGVPDLAITVGISGAVIAALIEILSRGRMDNLAVPVGAGIGMTVLMKVM